MADCWLDLNDSGSLNTGTSTEPFNDFSTLRSALIAGTYNRVILPYDSQQYLPLNTSSLDQWTIPAGLNNVTFMTDSAGGTYPAIFRGDAAVTNGTWTLYSGNIYYKDGFNTNVGVVMQDQGGHLPEPLTWSATLAGMTEGSYFHDTTLNRIYVWQTGGGAPLDISVATQRRWASPLLGNSGWLFDWVGWCGFSRLAMNAEQLTDSQWIDAYVRNCGGSFNGSVRLGGGLQNSKGCKHLQYVRPNIHQVWDSPLSTQDYTAGGADMEDIAYLDIDVGEGAGCGLEFSHWSTNNKARGILVRGGTISNMGSGFSGSGDSGWLVPTGVFITTSGTTNNSVWERVTVEDVVISNCQDSGIYGKRLSGLLKIRRVQIKDCPYGIREEDSANTLLRPTIDCKDTLITGSTTAAVNINSAYATSQQTFENMTLDSNAIGMRVQASGSNTVELIASNVTNNTTGLVRTGGTFNTTKCNLFGNTTATSGTITATNAITPVDPNYVNAAGGDYEPQAAALIGTGPGLAGSRRGLRGNARITDDIGAFAVTYAGQNDFQELIRYASDVSLSADTLTFTFQGGAIQSGDSITPKYTRPDERLDSGLWAACRQANLTLSNNTIQYAWGQITSNFNAAVQAIHAGLVWYVEPSELNPSPGVWDLSGVIAAADYAQSIGKLLGLGIRSRTFGNADVYNPFPAHLCANVQGVINKEDTAVAAYDYSPASGGGWQAATWRRAAIDWMKEALERIHEAIGDHPAFAYLDPKETSIAEASLPADYTPEAHRDGYIEIWTYAAKLFQGKVSNVRPNFLFGNQAYVGEIIDEGIKWGCHVAVTDVLQSGSANAGISYTSLDTGVVGPSTGTGPYDYLWRNALGNTETQAQLQNHSANDTTWTLAEHLQFAIADDTNTPSGVLGFGAGNVLYFWQSPTNTDQIGLYDYVQTITWSSAIPPIIPNFVNSIGAEMADDSDTAVAA